jgi:phage terminase large subunit-like protein
VPYQAWSDARFIIPTPGETTDLTFIREEILALRQKYRIVELGFDRFAAEDLAKSLEISGLKVTKVAQGWNLSAALLRTEKLIRDHKLCIHSHPIAAWCFSNAVLAHGALGDVRIERKRSREKVDLAAAVSIAVHTMMAQPAQRTGDDAYKIRFI